MLPQLVTVGKHTNLSFLTTKIAPKLTNSLTHLQFMEIAVRYSSELLLLSSLVPRVLEVFVGPLGIHSTEAPVQFRSWYLFERLLEKIQNHIVPMSDQVLASFTDLLQINVSLNSNFPFEAAGSDSENDSEQDVFFDNQLYLFQSAGLLIALTRSTNFKAGEVLLHSLIANINNRLEIVAHDQSLILNVHHTIMALGDIAKGFDNAVESISPRQQDGNRLFLPTSEIILKALTRFEDSVAIRDAVFSPCYPA
jgi:exportin-T